MATEMSTEAQNTEQRKPDNQLSKQQRLRWNGDQLRATLSQYDRRPFIDLLAEWLECHPTPESVQLFADKYPDRYAAAIRNIAGIAGFTEKREVAIDLNVNIRDMSDSQLEDALRKKIPEIIDLSGQEISVEKVTNGSEKAECGTEPYKNTIKF